MDPNPLGVWSRTFEELRLGDDTKVTNMGRF